MVLSRSGKRFYLWRLNGNFYTQDILIGLLRKMHILSVPACLTVYANLCPEAIFAVCLFAYSAFFCGGVYGEFHVDEWTVLIACVNLIEMFL